ncbi:MAG: lipid-A-disaccharide synthase [Syntrophorhabdaceae bacterium]
MPVNQMEQTVKNIFLSTGELSGEIHAFHLVESIKNIGNFHISAMGSEKLASIGVEIAHDYRDISVTGLSEVLSHLGSIRQAFSDIKEHIRRSRPDLVILVDFPGFNMRIARFAKSLGIPVIYFIPPQIWAWKRGRMKKIRQYVNQVVCILPFEKDIYKKEGVLSTYIGHPFAATVQPSLSRETFLENIGAPLDKTILTIMPGSRKNEVARHIPVLSDIVRIIRRSIPDITILVPLAENIDEKTINPLVQGDRRVFIVKNGSHNALAHCDAAIVASGSATLEAALLKAPTIIIYRISWLSYAIARMIVHVDYIGLPNIIAGKEVFPEYIQDLNPETIATKALSMIQKGKQNAAGELGCIVDKLIMPDSYGLAARAVVAFLEKEKNEPLPQTS